MTPSPASSARTAAAIRSTARALAVACHTYAHSSLSDMAALLSCSSFEMHRGVVAVHGPAKRRRASMKGMARKITPGTSVATVTGIQTC